jgi:ubiquinone/menaquinone biosynthesis C-methylase UbiE
MSENDVAGFYDSLAVDYHRLFADWQASAVRHGQALQTLIESAIGGRPLSALDCACGIGTQLIGLAPFGHRLHGTDLSLAAITRAEMECRVRGVTVQLRRADMRLLPHRDEAFDVVVCVDNALPHLLTADDASSAFGEWARVLRPGGLANVTTREYDELLVQRPTVAPVQRSTDDHAPPGTSREPPLDRRGSPVGAGRAGDVGEQLAGRQRGTGIGHLGGYLDRGRDLVVEARQEQRAVGVGLEQPRENRGCVGWRWFLERPTLRGPADVGGGFIDSFTRPLMLVGDLGERG